MTFREAVDQTPEIAGRCQAGKQALERIDRPRITLRRPRLIRGSLHLEEALRDTHPSDPLWDYGIALVGKHRKEYAVWVEVHPANSLHVDPVLSKLAWLRKWLRDDAPRLEALTPKANFVWLAAGAVALPQEVRNDAS